LFRIFLPEDILKKIVVCGGFLYIKVKMEIVATGVKESDISRPDPMTLLFQKRRFV